MRSGWGKLELPGPPEPTLKIEGLGGWREPGRGRKKALATEPPEIGGKMRVGTENHAPTQEKGCAMRAIVGNTGKKDGTYFSVVVETWRDTLEGGGA
jgi:hypothetical protein